jgi:16S rRNA (cytidine1402-2'-O)-methyltransferase
MQQGESVALVSDAGTPTVSDPGGLLIRAAIDAGLRVEPVPGPSAVLTALAASGLPTDSFTFLGFPPTRSKDRKIWFEKAALIRGTIVFFEAPHRIQATLHDVQRELGDCQAVLGRELTKIHEEFIRGPVSVLAKRIDESRGEFTVVLNIGDMAKNIDAMAASHDSMVAEFGVMTNNTNLTRRKAINVLARRHGIPPNRVYEILEEAKKSG